VKLFVYHTPELVPSGSIPDCAIAIDVLRATTTMVTALGKGSEAVQVFSSLDELMQVSERWPAGKRLRAGERGGAKVEGCDLGNSPLDCTPDLMTGRRLFMSTTNGTRCLERIQNATTVLAAALINRAAVVKFLLETQPAEVWMVGSGWEGSFALEDTVCAGAIAYELSQHLRDLSLGNDEAWGAIALYSQWKDNLLEFLHHASHGKRLLGLGSVQDLEYCAMLDTLDVLPIQKDQGILVRY
jgi:2-phosphosulfolactate phosphatase